MQSLQTCAACCSDAHQGLCPVAVKAGSFLQPRFPAACRVLETTFNVKGRMRCRLGPVGAVFERFGAVKAGPFTAARLLRQGEALLLFPGGGREVRAPETLRDALCKACC